MMKYKAGDRVLLAECDEETYGHHSPQEEATVLEACEGYGMYIVECSIRFHPGDDGIREIEESMILGRVAQ